MKSSALAFTTIAFILLSTDIVHAAPQNNNNFITATLNTCDDRRPRVRRDIRDLSQTERNRFFDAIKKLVQDNIYQPLVTKHSNGQGGFWDFGHSSPMFLPLHRCYLREFEDRLRDILGEDFSLPYWDWSLDSQKPGDSVIFTASYFGANDPANGYRISNGAFSAANFTAPGHPLVRQYNKDRMTAFHHGSVLARMLGVNRDFSAVSQDLEYGPHATVHTAIGGDSGDLSGRLSPFDPIFWMHHCYVDKLWFDWQAQGNNEEKFDGRAYGGEYTRVNPRSIIDPYNIPVSAVLKSEDVCVTYVQPKNNGTDSNVTLIRAPDALPDSWFNRTGVNKSVAENIANRTQNITNEANTNLTNGVPIAVPPTAPQPTKSNAFPTHALTSAFNLLLAITLYFAV